MTLRELIEKLEVLPKDKVFAKGFNYPHSWRGVYAELSFTPADNVTVAAMLKDARSCLGAAFQGYKGGDFQMDADTDVHLDEYGQCSDDGGRMAMLLADDLYQELRASLLAAQGEAARMREALADAYIWIKKQRPHTPNSEQALNSVQAVAVLFAIETAMGICSHPKDKAVPVEGRGWVCGVCGFHLTGD